MHTHGEKMSGNRICAVAAAQGGRPLSLVGEHRMKQPLMYLLSSEYEVLHRKRQQLVPLVSAAVHTKRIGKQSILLIRALRCLGSRFHVDADAPTPTLNHATPPHPRMTRRRRFDRVASPKPYIGWNARGPSSVWRHRASS